MKNKKPSFLVKATEVYGRGGATHVKDLTGAAFSTLNSGNIEANNCDEIVSEGESVEKGGTQTFLRTYPEFIVAIEKIIDGQTYGDPSKVIHWNPQSIS